MAASFGTSLSTKQSSADEFQVRITDYVEGSDVDSWSPSLSVGDSQEEVTVQAASEKAPISTAAPASAQPTPHASKNDDESLPYRADAPISMLSYGPLFNKRIDPKDWTLFCDGMAATIDQIHQRKRDELSAVRERLSNAAQEECNVVEYLFRRVSDRKRREIIRNQILAEYASDLELAFETQMFSTLNDVGVLLAAHASFADLNTYRRVAALRVLNDLRALLMDELRDMFASMSNVNTPLETREEIAGALFSNSPFMPWFDLNKSDQSPQHQRNAREPAGSNAVNSDEDQSKKVFYESSDVDALLDEYLPGFPILKGLFEGRSNSPKPSRSPNSDAVNNPASTNNITTPSRQIPIPAPFKPVEFNKSRLAIPQGNHHVEMNAFLPRDQDVAASAIKDDAKPPLSSTTSSVMRAASTPPASPAGVCNVVSNLTDSLAVANILRSVAESLSNPSASKTTASASANANTTTPSSSTTSATATAAPQTPPCGRNFTTTATAFPFFGTFPWLQQPQQRCQAPAAPFFPSFVMAPATSAASYPHQQAPPHNFNTMSELFARLSEL